MNWDSFARHAVQRIHREALSPADLRASLDRIARHPDLPQDWWAFDIRYAFDPVFTIEMQAGAERRRFVSITASIATPTSALAQELRVETLFPADAETEHALQHASV